MITVMLQDLKPALDFIAKQLSKDPSRPVLNCVHLYVKNNRLFVESISGYAIARTSVNLEESQKEPFSVLVNPFKLTGKAGPVNLIQGSKFLSIENLYNAEKTELLIQPGEAFDTGAIIPPDGREPEYSICVSPQNLIDAAAAFKDKKDVVTLSFFGPYAPITMTHVKDDSLQLFLPCRKAGD